MKPALLVIDVQKEFFSFSPATAQSLNDAIECINAAIALFREKHLPIICIQHVEEEDDLVLRLQPMLLTEASLRGEVFKFREVNAVGNNIDFLLIYTVAYILHGF